MKACGMVFLLGLTYTAFTFAGDYSDAVDKDKMCSDLGQVAVQRYDDSVKSKNPFKFSLDGLTKANKYLKKAQDDLLKGNRSAYVMEETLGEVYGYDPQSKKDAYMHAWAKCMDLMNGQD